MLQSEILPSSESIPCCATHMAAMASAIAANMSLPLPAIDDEEGASISMALPPVVDAHVHVFPDAIFRAVWRWFDAYGWPIRYKLHAREVVTHLLERGVAHLVLLHYAHKPGIARSMNAFVADLVKDQVQVTGLATVFPGEPNQEEILSDAFAQGLRGVKLHCHVQAIAADDHRNWPVYELCQSRGLPVVIHAGREPWSGNLPCNPHEICNVERIERVLREFPHLKLCVPHLGADEFDAYVALLMKFDNLWLDSTMMLGEYFAVSNPWPWVRARPDRVIYGSDFPNLPYAWDRETKAIEAAKLPDATVEMLVGANARQLYGIR